MRGELRRYAGEGGGLWPGPGQVENVRSSLTSEDSQGAIGQGYHAVRWLAAAQVLLVVLALCKTQPAGFVSSLRTA